MLRGSICFECGERVSQHSSDLIKKNSGVFYIVTKGRISALLFTVYDFHDKLSGLSALPLTRFALLSSSIT